MSVIKRTLDYIKKSRQNIIEGNINSIKSPFRRFIDDFIGVQKGKLYLITAATKASKTQLTSFLFIYNSLFYAIENPDKIKLKIFYYPLEETQELVTLRFMSFLLYVLSDKQLIVSIDDLQSAKNEVLSQDVIQLLESEEYQRYLKFFEECIEFSSTTNVTGIYKEVRTYVQNNGTSHYKNVTIKNEFGELEEVSKFDYYVPNDPKEYVIFLVDHVGELTIERGFNKKENIDKLGDYAIELRNRYDVTSILIQQQLVNESTDNFKMAKLRPTITNLQDTKYLAQKANVVLGIFSPHKYELETYMGYDITTLKDNCRFLEVLASRNGQSNGITALYFNGAVCYFKQLPLPNDPAIGNYYTNIKNSPKRNFVMLVYSLLNKFKTNG